MDGAEPARGSSLVPLDLRSALRTPSRAYLLEQLGPTPSEAELDAMDRALGLACLRLAAVGHAISLLATTYLGVQERWLGLCLADSVETAHRAAMNAQLYGVTITEV